MTEPVKYSPSEHQQTDAIVRSESSGAGSWRAWLGWATARWQAISPREQMAVRLAAMSLGILLVWQLAIAPALRVLREAPIELARLEAQTQELQALAVQSKDWAGVAPVSAAQAQEAIKAASNRLGDKAQISIQGDRATLRLSGVSAEAFKTWLIEARSGARARVTEAQLSQAQGSLSGTVVMTLQGIAAP
jgi:general secretion pathway protein M